MRQRILGTILLCLLTASSNAALLGRAPLTSGGTDYQAYYDTVLNITWTADANLAATESFGLPRNVGYPDINGNNPIVTGELGPDGEMSWYTAVIWVGAMNSASYLGQTGWRLPTIHPLDGVALNSTGSNTGQSDNGRNVSAPGTIYAGSTAHEMANLYYNTLIGNVAGYFPVGEEYGGQCVTFPANGGDPDLIPACLQNTGPFANLLPTIYWEGLPANDWDAWGFDWREGYQGTFYKASTVADAVPNLDVRWMRAWAVIDGDPLISTVPVPAAAWLFGGALGALGLLRRGR